MQDCMDTYGGLVWSLARRLSTTSSEAEEAVQEIFISLWENASRFDPEKMKEATFVAMIARRRLIDRFRKTQRHDKAIRAAGNETATTFDAEPETEHASEEVSQVMEALASLSPDQQKVIRLAVHGGLSHSQIAEQTGYPLGTVKTHVRRGLQRIRDMIEQAPSEQPAGGAS